jgi:hypothetical protein
MSRNITGYNRIQWDTPGYNGIHRDTMGYTGIQWDTSGYTGIQWDTSGYTGIQWDTSGYNGIHRDTMGYIGIQWDTSGYNGIHRDTIKQAKNRLQHCASQMRRYQVYVGNVGHLEEEGISKNSGKTSGRVTNQEFRDTVSELLLGTCRHLSTMISRLQPHLDIKSPSYFALTPDVRRVPVTIHLLSPHGDDLNHGRVWEIPKAWSSRSIEAFDVQELAGCFQIEGRTCSDHVLYLVLWRRWSPRLMTNAYFSISHGKVLANTALGSDIAADLGHR